MKIARKGVKPVNHCIHSDGGICISILVAKRAIVYNNLCLLPGGTSILALWLLRVDCLLTSIIRQIPPT